MFYKMNVVIKETISSLQLKKKIKQYEVMNKWKEIVGEEIDRNSAPSYIRGNTLYVEVSSSTWAHQLTLIKNELIRRLNQSMEASIVKDIRFKATGVVKDKENKLSCKGEVETLTSSETKRIEGIAREVKEPNIMRSFKRAMEKDMKFKKIKLKTGLWRGEQ